MTYLVVIVGLIFGELPAGPLPALPPTITYARWTFLDQREARHIALIADSWNFNQEQADLLAIIRRVENGRDHVAFGVKKKSAKTWESQAHFAAETIQLRYTGDLRTFGKRWCPADHKNWNRMASYYRRQL